MMMVMMKGNRMRFHIRGGSGSFVRALLMAGLAVLVICMGALARQTSRVEAAAAAAAVTADEDASTNYLGQAKRLLDSGTNQQPPSGSATRLSISGDNSRIRSSTGQPLSLLSSSSDRDPYLEQQLRQSIKVATDLINNYRKNGLSSLPSLPNLPGVGTVMRLPDKLLRAELSMIQDEIRMAMEMMNNPLAATVNAPRDIASMFYRMAEQLEQ